MPVQKLIVKRQLNFEAEIKAAAEKHKKLWAAINQYVRRKGGWLTSAPGQRVLRIEIPQFSTLGDELHDLGYARRQLALGNGSKAGSSCRFISSGFKSHCRVQWRINGFGAETRARGPTELAETVKAVERDNPGDDVRDDTGIEIRQRTGNERAHQRTR